MIMRMTKLMMKVVIKMYDHDGKGVATYWLGANLPQTYLKTYLASRFALPIENCGCEIGVAVMTTGILHLSLIHI